MIYFDQATQQFVPYRLRATFYDRDTLRVKYDNSEKYWQDFVNRWWHHHSLTFTPVTLTAEQQDRLDEVNAQEELLATERLWEGTVAEYVEWGSVDPNNGCPYLGAKAEEPAVVAARLHRLRQEHIQALADYRFKIETSGVTTDEGMVILTDRESQAQLNGAYNTLREGLGEVVDWKSATGWIRVSLDDILPVAREVFIHVQSCFTAERRVTEALEAITDEATLRDFDVIQAFNTERTALLENGLVGKADTEPAP